MATSKTFLVPVDFSRGSEIALKHARKLAKESRGKLILVHVLQNQAIYPTEDAFMDYYGILKKDAEKGLRGLVRRMRLKPREYRWIMLQAFDTGLAIARQAKKSRASMIVMSSHGRTGLRRLMLGSVAERTLRYAECPVLIVKK